MIYLIKTKLNLISSPELRVFWKFCCIIILATELLAFFAMPFIAFNTPILITIIWATVSIEILFESFYTMKMVLRQSNKCNDRLIVWSVFANAVFCIFASLTIIHIDRHFSLNLNIYKAISSAILLSLFYLIVLLLFQAGSFKVKNSKIHFLYLTLLTLLIGFVVTGIVIKPYNERITVLFLSFGVTALYFLITYYFLKVILQLDDEAKKITIMTMCTIIFIAVLLATSFIVRSWITDEKLQSILMVIAAEIIGGAFTLVSVVITIRVGHIDTKRDKEELNEHKAIEAKEKNKPLFAIRLLTKKQIPSSANICIFKTPSENAFITYALFQNSDNSNFRIISLTIGETVYPIEHTHFVLKNELFCLVFHVCNKELENIVLKCQDIHHNDYYYKLFLHKMKNEEFYTTMTFEEIDYPNSI